MLCAAQKMKKWTKRYRSQNNNVYNQKRLPVIKPARDHKHTYRYRYIDFCLLRHVSHRMMDHTQLKPNT